MPDISGINFQQYVQNVNGKDVYVVPQDTNPEDISAFTAEYAKANNGEKPIVVLGFNLSSAANKSVDLAKIMFTLQLLFRDTQKAEAELVIAELNANVKVLTEKGSVIRQEAQDAKEQADKAAKKMMAAAGISIAAGALSLLSLGAMAYVNRSITKTASTTAQTAEQTAKKAAEEAAKNAAKKAAGEVADDAAEKAANIARDAAKKAADKAAASVYSMDANMPSSVASGVNSGVGGAGSMTGAAAELDRNEADKIKQDSIATQTEMDAISSRAQSEKQRAEMWEQHYEKLVQNLADIANKLLQETTQAMRGVARNI